MSFIQTVRTNPFLTPEQIEENFDPEQLRLIKQGLMKNRMGGIENLHKLLDLLARQSFLETKEPTEMTDKDYSDLAERVLDYLEKNKALKVGFDI